MSELLAPHEVALGADQPWRRPELKRHVEEAGLPRLSGPVSI